MKLFERRLRVSKLYLAAAIFFAALAILSFASGSTMLVGGHSHGRQLILRAKDPASFALVAGGHVAGAVVFAFLSRYQFRRGSWFNPIK
jgi:hypothetical protein